jgi:hypothetical protein
MRNVALATFMKSSSELETTIFKQKLEYETFLLSGII